MSKPTINQLRAAVDCHLAEMYGNHPPDGIWDIELYQAFGFLPADYDVDAAQLDDKVSLLLLIERLLAAAKEVPAKRIPLALWQPLEALQKNFKSTGDEFDKLEALVVEQSYLFTPERRARLRERLDYLDHQPEVETL